MEYAAILLLLKKRRKPKYSIDVGLKKMFNNGDATQPLQGGRRAGSGGPGTPTSAGAMEEAKRMVSHFLITLIPLVWLDLYKVFHLKNCTRWKRDYPFLYLQHSSFDEEYFCQWHQVTQGLYLASNFPDRTTCNEIEERYLYLVHLGNSHQQNDTF